MEHRQSPPVRTNAGRATRILVESDTVDLAAIDFPVSAAGVDVVVCSGPGAHEACPLVTDGTCPLTEPDVVVCGLAGEWRQSVEAAWRRNHVPVFSADPAMPWPHHLGAALGVAFRGGADRLED